MEPGTPCGQAFRNGWRHQLDEPNLYIGNGWKSPFPSIYKWLALGFQEPFRAPKDELL